MNGNKTLSEALSFNGQNRGRVDEIAKVVTFHPSTPAAISNGSKNLETSGEFKSTPERDVNRESRVKELLIQAPRSKLPSFPVVRSKIKPSDAASLAMQTKVANGSGCLNHKKGEFKRKVDHNSVLAENPTKLPKPLSQFLVQQTSTNLASLIKQKDKLHTCSSASNGFLSDYSSNQNLATVIVSKGIEMKRVEAKIVPVSSTKTSGSSSGTNREVVSNGIAKSNSKAKIKTKDFSNTSPKANRKIVESSTSTRLLKSKQTSSNPNNGKSKSQLPSKPDANNQIASKHHLAPNDVKCSNPTTNTELLLPSEAVESIESSIKNKNNKIAIESKNSQPVDSYKTLKEFLDMPAVSLPEKKVEPEKSKDLYKSSFWEYVDPKRRQNPCKTTGSDKQKPYDALAVKSFMEKQKEIRRLNEMKEYQERKKELENKKKQLLELDEKCKNLVKKGSITCRRKHTHSDAHDMEPVPSKKRGLQALSPTSALNNFRKSRGFQNAQISAIKGICDHNKVTECSGEATKRATLLLKEFETIVKRECSSFFSTRNLDREDIKAACSKVDKAVETTLSLEMQNSMGMDESVSSGSSMKSHGSNVLGLHSAAAKIQAAYRGYQIRKILKEAKLMPGYKKSFIVKDDRFRRLCTDDIRQRRRMSFYRTPEKPYDCKSKLKAAPISAFGKSSTDPQVHLYIPPVMNSFSPRVSSHPQVLFPLGIPSARLNRSFDEPYPKEAIQKLQGTSPNVSTRPSAPDLFEDNVRGFLTRAKAENEGARNNYINISGHRIPETSTVLGPSIADVLMEKLRLYAVEKEKNKTSKPEFTWVDSTRLTSLEVPYDTDFESVSSITRNTDQIDGEVSHDVSITDDYFGPSDSEPDARRRSSTPKSKSRSPSRRNQQQLRGKSKSPRLNSSVESSTTVDTDADLIPTTDVDSSRLKNLNVPKIASKETPKTQSSSSISTPSVNIYQLPVPALKLRYQAEKEHLNILDKAIEATIAHEKAQVAGSIRKDEIFQMAKAAVDEQMSKLMKPENDKPFTDSMKLAMMCQEQASKTICEFTKWMTEMKKSSINEQNQTHNVRSNPVDLAVIVYAAVDEAKRISDERRKERQKSRQTEPVMNREIPSTTVIQQTKIIYQKDQQLQFPSCADGESSISASCSSYRKSFDTGTYLETADDKPVGKEIKAINTSDETLLETPHSNRKNNTLKPQVENITDIDIDTRKPVLVVPENSRARSIAKKVVEVEEDVHAHHDNERSSPHKREKVQLNSETEILDELSMLVESLHLSSKPEDVSSEVSEGVETHKTEIPDEMSFSNKLLDPVMSESMNYSSIDNINDSMEAESPRTDTVQDELEHSDSESGRPRSSHSECFDHVSEPNEKSFEEEGQEKQIVVAIYDKGENPDDKSKGEEVQEKINDSDNPEQLSEIDIQPLMVNTEVITKTEDPLNPTDRSNRSSELHQEKQDVVAKIVELVDKDIVLSGDLPIAGPADEATVKNCITITKVPKSIPEDKVFTDAWDGDDDEPKILEETIKDDSGNPNQIVYPALQVTRDSGDPLITIPDPSTIDAKEINVETETEIPEELSMLDATLSKSESFGSSAKIGPHKSDVSGSSKIKEKVTSESNHYSEDFIDDLSESIASADIDDVLNESDIQQEDVAGDVQSASQKIVEMFDNKAAVQQSSPLQMKGEISHDSDTEIPEELSLLGEESFDSSDKPSTSDLFVKHEEEIEVNKTAERVEVFEEDTFEEPTSVKYTLDLEDAKNHSEAITIPKISENQTELHQDQQDNTLEECKAAHVIVEIEDKEALQLEAAKILEERQRVENEIRELEALQNPITDYLNALESREKPPPPYSPPLSSESLSYSSRSFFVSIQDDKLRDTVVSRVDRIWDDWITTGTFPEELEVTEIESGLVQLAEDEDDDDDDKDRSQYATAAANSSFDLLIRELIDEATRNILHTDKSSKSFVNSVRRGPLGIEAQMSRIPRTKAALISAVYFKAVNTIPKLLLPDKVKENPPKRCLMKYTCRPRDLVDDILVEEMLEEEYLWTELWPEELLITDEVTDKIIRDCVREVVRNCELALRG